MSRPRALAVALTLVACVAVTSCPTYAWNVPGYALRWPADPTYNLASDGQYRVLSLDQPPIAFDDEGGSLGPFGQNLIAVPPLYGATALGVAPNGHLYVRNTWFDGQRMIVEIDQQWRFIRRFPLPPEFENPDDHHYGYRGIAIDGDGRVYLADADIGSILVFGEDGQHLATWGSQGSGVGQFDKPYRLQFDANGILFVADRGNYRIQRITREGVFLAPLEIPGLYFKDFGFDRAGNIYCLDGYGVRVYDSSLREIGHWNNLGPGETFHEPRFLVLDANDNVYVADRGSYWPSTTSAVIAKFDPRISVEPPNAAYSPKLVLTALPASETTHPCETVRAQPLEEARTSGDLAAGDPGPFYFVCLLVARGNGSYLAGLQCGLSYKTTPSDPNPEDRIRIFDWHLCADLEFPTPADLPQGASAWPGPGSGNLITWDPINNCQLLELAVAGYFYVGAYESSVLKLTPRPVDNTAKVAYCATSGEHPLTLDDLGFVSFSPGAQALGCNPVLKGCAETVAIRPTTWSAIKAIVR